MDDEVERFRKRICQVYLDNNFDIQKQEPFVYQHEDYWTALLELHKHEGYNYTYLKTLFDSIPRPAKTDIDSYKLSPDHKITNGSYSHFDDRTFGLSPPYPKEIPSYLKLLGLISKYESEEEKHVHKGTIYYFLLDEYFKQNNVELGLLFMNKAFIEDDLKHTDTSLKFPNSPAYKFLVLNSDNPNQALVEIVQDIVTFIKDEFMNNYGYNYDDFWNGFLNEATNKADDVESHKWFDHVIFFNSFIVRLKKTYDYWDIYDSIYGEIELSNLIGDLCLLIESFCKIKLNLPGVTIGDVYYHSVNGVKKIYTWTNYYHRNDFNGNNFQASISSILDNNYNGCNDHVQNSFYLTWALRNNFHHNIESMSFIKKEFKKIIKMQLHFFFDFAINH